MSRPTKLTPTVEAAILDALRRGNTRTAAFESAGVHRSKISIWLARFATFRDAVTRAEAEAEVQANGALHDAYQAGDWRAAFAWLERRRHADWGKVDRLEIEIRRTAERVAQQTGADPDWLVKRAAEIVAVESGAER
jgi:hypothetical protein